MRLPSTGFKLSKLGQRGPSALVGLDIQPGYATAVEVRVNGGLHIQRAAGVPLPGDAMREGEVLDEGTLADALKELFGKAHLDKRVRVGVANQRTVLRMLEMPPLPEGKELAAAVRFQAEDQMPMPLDNAVLDYHPLGVIDTPAGPRQRVAVVAAQRDMIERLLSAVRRAGLRPEAVDLSAFALIRALYRAQEAAVTTQGEASEISRTLYLNVGGLTNLAIAEGLVCRFTRVVSGGLESMASAIAERHHLPLSEARELLAGMDLDPSLVVPVEATAEPPAEPLAEAPTSEIPLPPAEPATSEMDAVSGGDESIDVLPVMENGIREIASDIRNSLDFHRMQGGGGEVTSIVMSGPALAISGFSERLSRELGMEIRRQTVAAADGDVDPGISAEHLAVAAGLAIEEAPGA